jgi:nucleotide-binding universal stress UspA family protein
MKRFKNILFFADGSEEMSPALQRAVQLAESNQARLTLVDVIEPVKTPAEITSRFNIELSDLLIQHRKQVLEELSQSIMQDDNLVYVKVLSGLPFVEVIKYVQRGGFDLLIKMASAPAGISEKLFGSVDLHLLRKCPCPVLIDRPNSSTRYQRILAAVDTDSSTRQGCGDLVMQLASSLRERENARLDIVHAWKLPYESTLRRGRFRLADTELQMLLKLEQERHQSRLQALLEPYGIAVDDENVQLVKGEAAKSINRVAEQKNSDIIVMGTLGRVGIPGLFIGNTAEEIIQTTKCSLLAVKPTGFISPVE